MDPIIFWDKLGEIPKSQRSIKKVTVSLAIFAHEYELTYDRKIENYENFKNNREVDFKN